MMSNDDDTRRPRVMGQLTADDPSGVGPTIVGPTIVGGQPPSSPRKQINKVPVGVERVLYTAAMEPAFRERLLAEREAAIEARGFTLRPSELAMIRLAPAEQLAAAIDNLDTSDRDLKRRGFLRAVAASLVTLAAADTISACAEDVMAGQVAVDRGGQPGDWGTRDTLGVDAGVRQDMAVDLPRAEMSPVGIRPDQGAVDLEIDLGPAVDGIRPDGGE